jgi:putative hydrolase
VDEVRPAGSPQQLALSAIDRAIALLDRGLADPYRVGAFIKARSTVTTIRDAELRRRAIDNTLHELPAIGAKTAGVIRCAVLNEPDRYLESLEVETQIPVTPEGAVLRAALKGDLHAHTDWSDGGATIEAMAQAAAGLGHEYLAITDHSGRLTVAKGLDASRLSRQLDQIDDLRQPVFDRHGVRLLTGVEVDINEDGSLDGDEDALERLDVVVASVHSRLSMPEAQMTERLLLAVTHPHVDVLGHCTGRKVTGRGRSGSTANWDLVFAACAAYGTAIEINCRPERLDPPRALLRRANELGCAFAIDSDAHAPGQLEWQPLGCDRAAEVGVAPDRVINAKPWKELQEWTNSKWSA